MESSQRYQRSTRKRKLEDVSPKAAKNLEKDLQLKKRPKKDTSVPKPTTAQKAPRNV